MATIKLVHGTITRKVQFPDEHPSWTDVSARVEQLFRIPSKDVALSFVDPDGDTMYISSNDELFDMFHTVTSNPTVHRFTVHDMRNSHNKSPDDFEHVPRDDDDSSSSSSSSSSGGKTPQIPPNFAESKSTRSGFGSSGGMGFGFAPFEMMFGQAATAASVKSPSQGHISPIPSGSELGAAAAEAGQSRSQYGRSVASSVTGRDFDGNPSIHIQGPSTDNESVMTEQVEHAEPEPLHHPTPALYQDVASLLHSLSDAVASHPAVSHNFSHLFHNAHTGVYWDEEPHPADQQQAAAHHLLNAFNSLLHTLLPPPPPRTPTQVPATPAYTAAQYELPPSVAAPSTAAPSTVAPDETPVPSRLNTPSVAQVPLVASPAMTATSLHSASTVGPGIRPVLDMARADRASVRSDTDAGSVVSGSGMGSPIRGTGPAWRFAGRSGGQPNQWGNINTGAMVPAHQSTNAPEAAKYVESRVKLEHMKEMYKQTKEEYRREREERKRERESKKQQANRLIGPPEPYIPAHGDMFDKLNEALAQVPGRVGLGESSGRKGMVPPPAPKSVADSVDTNVRTRQQLINWLIEQLGDMGFSAATHPQVSRMVRDATRPYATNAENANENQLLEDLLAQLVPTGSK